MGHDLTGGIEDCEFCQRNFERWSTPSGVMKMPQKETVSAWPAVMAYISSLTFIGFLVWVFFG